MRNASSGNHETEIYTSFTISHKKNNDGKQRPKQNRVSGWSSVSAVCQAQNQNQNRPFSQQVAFITLMMAAFHLGEPGPGLSGVAVS